MYGFFHSLSTFGLVFLTFFTSTHHTDPHTNQIPVVQEIKHEKDNQILTARGSLSKFGQIVTFTFTFPENGGNMQGAITGACSGNIQGTYSGNNLIGTANASCPIFPTTLTGTATFTGSLNDDKKSAVLHTHVVTQWLSENIDIPVTISR